MSNKFCLGCGTAMEEGMRFCTVCGASAAPAPAPQAAPAPTPAPAPQAPTPQPAAEPRTAAAVMEPPAPPQQPAFQPALVPGPDSKYEAMTTGNYLGAMLLMAIPVVGWILTLVWAFGGCRKVNKRNLARAMLVWMLIALVLGGVTFFVGQALINTVWEAAGLTDLLGQFGGLGNLTEQLGELGNLTEQLSELGDLSALTEQMGQLPPTTP